MEFKELIEARRSVRKYVAREISKAEVEEIVGEAAGTAAKPHRCSHFATQSSLRSADIRKPVGEVVKVS